MTILSTSNLVGILFARSLHYQFLSWSAHQLIFLVWHTPYETVQRFAILGAIEFGWNTFPSTHATVGFVVLAAVVILWPWQLDRAGTGLAVAAALVIAVVIAVGNVAWYAHRPVDVLGSLGLVSAPVLLALGVLACPTRGRQSGL